MQGPARARPALDGPAGLDGPNGTGTTGSAAASRSGAPGVGPLFYPADRHSN